MSLHQFLSENRSTLVKKWVDLVIATYPKDSQRFFHKEKNKFANPIGQTISREVELLYDELAGGGDRDKITSCLDNILRIQAIQNMEPSRAVAFVFQLKGLVRERLKKSAASTGASKDLHEFENRMDELALMAFDVYSKRRQTIYDLRVNEIRREVSRLLQRANLVVEIPEMGSGNESTMNGKH